MAASGGRNNLVARRVIKDLIDINGERSSLKYLKIFIEQQINNHRRFIAHMRDEIRTSTNLISQLNTLIAELEASGDYEEVFDLVMELRDNRRDEIMETQAIDDQDPLVNYDNDNENDDLVYQSEEYFDDVQEDDENNHSNGNVVKRGITRLYKFCREYEKPDGIKLSVTFEALNRISGKHKKLFLSFLGDMVREHIGLKILSWKKKEIEDKFKEGTLKVDHGTDAMTVVLSKEKGGYARGVGSGVTYKRYFDLPQSRQASDERILLLQSQLDNERREQQEKELLIQNLSNKMSQTEGMVTKLKNQLVAQGGQLLSKSTQLKPPNVSSVDVNLINSRADKEGETKINGCENDASIQKSNGLATLEKEMETRALTLEFKRRRPSSSMNGKEKIASNLKFLNNLQQEWSRHVTIVHQTKDLHTADYTQLYDFLKYNQKEVDDLKAKRLTRTQDPLALMATFNNPYTFPVLHQDQPSFNQNYMQQPMPNPEDITDPTTAMNMVLALMDKAFKLNHLTPTNNNQRISSNPRNRQIAQPGMNMGQDRQMQMVGVQNPRIQNVGNHNGLIVVPRNANQNPNGNGNLVAARVEGNTTRHVGNQIRCYNCRGLGHFARNCTVKPRRRDAAYLQTQLLVAQKEEAGIQLQAEEFDLIAAVADLDEIEEFNANCTLMANLQQASTSGTQANKAPVYDSDGSAEVHNYENCYDNEIFNMFTQGEQYTELLEPIPEPHQVPQNDDNVISEVSRVEQSGGTVEQYPANVEETRVLYDSLYNNLAIEVEKVNTVNRKLRETNAELTTELARYKNQEMCFEISQEKYDKLERCYQKSIYQEQCLSKKINDVHLSFGKQIMTLNEEISDLNKQLSVEKSTVSSLLEEKKKLKSDLKIYKDELLDKQIQLEKKIKELDNILVKTGQSIHMISPKPDSFYHTEQKMALGCQNPFYLKQAQQKQQSFYDGKVLFEKHAPLVVHDSKETLQLAQESRQKMKLLNKEIKPTNYTKINHLSRIFVSKMVKSREELYFLNNSKTANVSKPISISNEEFLDDTTPSVARKFLNEVKSTIVTLQRVVKQRMTLDTHNWSSSTHQELHKIVKDDIFPIVNQVDARVQNFKIQFLKEAAKFVGNFKSLAKEADEPLAKKKALELEIERLLRVVVRQDIMSVVQNKSVGETSNLQTELELTSNSIPTPQGSKVVKNDKVIAPGMFRINHFKPSKEEKHVPNKVRASVRTNPITVSQPPVITKKVVNSDSNGLSYIGVDNTAKTRRPQPRSNTKNNRVPSVSKSSCIKNKEVDVEEHYRKLLLSRKTKHMSSECNNIKLATHNVKSKVVCAMCKQCLIIVNHDECLLNYVNGMTSHGKKQKENVSINEKQKKQQPKVKKTKKVGSIERLASPKPNKPRSFLRTDNSTEFKNKVLKEYFDSVGISHQVSSVRTPQQNGVVERRNRTLVEAARTMLIFSRASLFLWDEAITTACFTQNRFIIHCCFNKTPYELINGRKLDISFLHVSGALCYPKNDREDIGKLGAKGDIGFFIGYSADSCAFRVYNRRTKKIMETMNVSFDELSAMAFEQRSSKPGLQSMTSGQITIYDDYIGGQPSAALKIIPAAQAHQIRQTPTTSTSIADTAPTPTNSSSQATIFPNTS
nr:integrase, catalytic region, zinc finger, CCHC-type, peptidase aspartic, catalytic [Tanacetum cinerariifolium]